MCKMSNGRAVDTTRGWVRFRDELRVLVPETSDHNRQLMYYAAPLLCVGITELYNKLPKFKARHRISAS